MFCFPRSGSRGYQGFFGLEIFPPHSVRPGTSKQLHILHREGQLAGQNEQSETSFPAIGLRTAYRNMIPRLQTAHVISGSHTNSIYVFLVYNVRSKNAQHFCVLLKRSGVQIPTQ